jgi:hypothetical protein
MKIIAFGNSKYKRIALNWAKHLEMLDITNYIIYSMDRDIYNFLNSNKINTEMIPTSIFDEHHPDWARRFRIIYDQLCSGDIIHSDLDAIWLKNPEKYITPKYDIISSSGNMPARIYERLGLSLCMGWIYIKSTLNTKKLFESIINSKATFDDQILVNNYLMDQGISSVSKIGSNASNIVFGDINTLVLDQSVISRHKPHDNNTYIAHPLTTRHIDRELYFQKNGLWCLDDK